MQFSCNISNNLYTKDYFNRNFQKTKKFTIRKNKSSFFVNEIRFDQTEFLNFYEHEYIFKYIYFSFLSVKLNFSIFLKKKKRIHFFNMRKNFFLISKKFNRESICYTIYTFNILYNIISRIIYFVHHFFYDRCLHPSLRTYVLMIDHCI